MSNTESQPREINYRALNLRDEQRVAFLTDIWNPHFLTPADHAQMMDQQYGKGDEEAYFATPSPSVSPENAEKPFTPPNNANEIEPPRT